MEVITYSLKNGDDNSQKYYHDIVDLTDSVMCRAEGKIKHALIQYKKYLTLQKKENLRSDEEYIYDLLSLGVFWTIYSKRAVRVSPIITHVLTQMYLLRRRYKKLKPSLDYLRGVLATLFLTRDNKSNGTVMPVLENFKHLIQYLDATGEFREEVKRFNMFYNYLSTLYNAQVEDYIISLVEFAEWFTETSAKTLNPYTANVDSFIKNRNPEQKWRENYIFCGRKREEYHVSMVGAELMNRAFKRRFNQTERKAVLLPACMRTKSAEECQAKKMTLDYTCSGCDKNCRIHEYTKLGKEYGFEVHIIPHSSDFTAWLQNWAAGKNIGVIGVACILNLMTGGLELKSLDIPAQCILLDYCGCSNHWHHQGIPTDLNKEMLLDALNVKHSNILALKACA